MNPSYAVNKRRLACPLGMLLVAGLACDDARPTADPSSGKLAVAVSIPPQADFVERIGGEHVTVSVLVGPGQSPATYQPTPRQMVELARARLLFRIGVPFEERLLTKLADTHPRLEVIDTRKGITLRRMNPHDDDHDHDHGHGDGGNPDPHIWLDPMLVKIQARTICDALKTADPDHAGDYEANLAVFEADLDTLHANIKRSLAPIKGSEFFVFHPSFGYFGDAYGLKQVAVETGGRQPGPLQLETLITNAKSTGVKLIFVQREFSSGSVRALAEAIGGKVVTVDPLARDYLDGMTRIASQFTRLPPSTEGLAASRGRPVP